MNKVIFTCQYFTIRVKEIVIFLVLLILLLFCFKGCQQNKTAMQLKNQIEKETEIKKEEKIVNICDFTNENIKDLNTLLSRVDLCSEEWFKDYDDYIARIEDQNNYLKRKKEAEYKEVLDKQQEILSDLKKFKNKQNEKNMEELEKSITNYKNLYDEKCGKGKVGI